MDFVADLFLRADDTLFLHQHLPPPALPLTPRWAIRTLQTRGVLENPTAMHCIHGILDLLALDADAGAPEAPEAPEASFFEETWERHAHQHDACGAKNGKKALAQ